MIQLLPKILALEGPLKGTSVGFQQPAIIVKKGVALHPWRALIATAVALGQNSWDQNVKDVFEKM